MGVTFEVKDRSLVSKASQEEFDAAGIQEGAKFVAVKTTTGLKLVPEEIAEEIAVARFVMEEDRDVLQRLAQ